MPDVYGNDGASRSVRGNKRSGGSRVEISGKPGAYTGQIVTSQGRQLKLVDVMTSSTAMIITGTSTTDSGLVFMRVTRQPSGGFSGVWANLPEVGSVTMQKK